MTVNFVTAKTGIFARLGKIFGAWSRMVAFQDDIINNAGTSVQEAINEYVNTLGATSNTDLKMADAIIKSPDDLQNAIGMPLFGRLKQTAVATVVEMMQADLEAETPASGLPSKTVPEALYELRNQMIANSKSVDGTTITVASTAAGGSNTGTGTVVVSAEPDNYKNSTHAFYPTARTETIRFSCYEDARSKRRAKGSELFEVRGAERFGSSDHRWPGGSGFVGRFACSSDSQNDGRRAGRNILRNSSFEGFVSNTPTAWEIKVGGAGSTIYKDTSVYARGAAGLKMVGDGTNAIRIHQQLGNIDVGSPVGVKPDALYCISFLARKSGTGSSAGSLTVGLSNSSGTFVGGCSIGVAHGSLSASAFGIFTTTFRAPLDLIDPVYFTVTQGTAFTSGTNVHVDGLIMAEMLPTAKGGVHFLIVPGATDFVRGDEFTVDITNNGEGAMHAYMDRFFNLYQSGIFMPGNVVGGETVADSLIA
tara:strand:+ start:2908 stop:4341 length:1434 start_codon:yes stop_codon:yes gene_type:complete